jgi:hypothetical protein
MTTFYKKITLLIVKKYTFVSRFFDLKIVLLRIEMLVIKQYLSK